MMTDFPDWTGPEAVRRLNTLPSSDGKYSWSEDKYTRAVKALQQLMVDLNMPEPVDEAKALLVALNLHSAYDLTLIREALAKARGEQM